MIHNGKFSHYGSLKLQKSGHLSNCRVGMVISNSLVHRKMYFDMIRNSIFLINSARLNNLKFSLIAERKLNHKVYSFFSAEEMMMYLRLSPSIIVYDSYDLQLNEKSFEDEVKATYHKLMGEKEFSFVRVNELVDNNEPGYLDAQGNALEEIRDANFRKTFSGVKQLICQLNGPKNTSISS